MFPPIHSQNICIRSQTFFILLRNFAYAHKFCEEALHPHAKHLYLSTKLSHFIGKPACLHVYACKSLALLYESLLAHKTFAFAHNMFPEKNIAYFHLSFVTPRNSQNVSIYSHYFFFCICTQKFCISQRNVAFILQPAIFAHKAFGFFQKTFVLRETLHLQSSQNLCKSLKGCIYVTLFKWPNSNVLLPCGPDWIWFMNM